MIPRAGTLNGNLGIADGYLNAIIIVLGNNNHQEKIQDGEKTDRNIRETNDLIRQQLEHFKVFHLGKL